MTGARARASPFAALADVGSTRKRDYVASPRSLGDLAAAVSPASLLDLKRAKSVATVPSGSLDLVHRFLRGTRWAYVISTSTRTAAGVRNVSWAQFPLAELARRSAASKTCATTGECGE